MDSCDKAFSARMRRGMALSVLQILLGVGLCLLGLAVQLRQGQAGSPAFHLAWDIFGPLAFVLFALHGGTRFARCYRLLHNDLYRKHTLRAQEDERSQLIDRLAWKAMGRLLAAALEAAMLISLALVRLEVFWTCFALFLFWGVGMWVLRRWYGKRL